MTSCVVVDYGLCNIDSVARVLEELDAAVSVTRDPRVITAADRVVLPGVGAFGRAMANLAEWGAAEAIREACVGRGAPFLGICLGMQLMAGVGEEHGEHQGLGLIDGRVVRLRPGEAGERVPHIGWNEVEIAGAHPLFDGVRSGGDFYFVHSFHMQPDDDAAAIGRTPYCGGFVSAVQAPGAARFGVQFHPEKSQRLGRRLLANFLAV